MDLLQEYSKLNERIDALKFMKFNLAKKYYTIMYPDFDTDNILAYKPCDDCELIFIVITSFNIKKREYRFSKSHNVIENEFYCSFDYKKINDSGKSKNISTLRPPMSGYFFKLCNVIEFKEIANEYKLMMGKKITKNNLDMLHNILTVNNKNKK